MTKYVSGADGRKANHLSQGNTQQVTVSAVASRPIFPIGPQTQLLRLAATTPCHYAIGENPTAVQADTLLPANSIEYVGVRPGESISIVEDASGSGGIMTVTDTVAGSLLTNVMIHYDETTLQQSVGEITRWNNRGNGALALPAAYDINDISGPFLITNINGIPAVGRAGNLVANRIRSDQQVENKPYTIAIAFESDTLPIGGEVQDIVASYTGTSGVVVSLHGTDNVYRSEVIGGGSVGVGPLSLGPQVIVSKVDFAGSDNSIRLSGGGEDSGYTQGGIATSSFIRLFATVPSAGTNQFLGSIGELLVWDSLLTDSEILEVESFLARKWGAPQ